VPPRQAAARDGEDVDGEGRGGGADCVADPVAAVLGVIAAAGSRCMSSPARSRVCTQAATSAISIDRISDGGHGVAPADEANPTSNA